MKSVIQLIFISYLAVVLSGCAAGPSSSRQPSKQSVASDTTESHLIKSSYDAVDRVINQIEHSHLKHELQKNKPIMVASFVDIDYVQHSSTFGRMIAEEVASRFSQSGYPVIELKMRPDTLVIYEELNSHATGEKVLSRNLQHLTFEHDAQAVVVGTYAPAKNYVYVTMKVIRSRDGIIIYSYDYRLPMDADTKSLLRSKRKRVR